MTKYARTSKRRSTGAHHPVFPSWNTHDIGHVFSDREMAANTTIGVVQPSFLEHRASALDIELKS